MNDREIIEDFGHGITTLTIVLEDGVQYEVLRQKEGNETPERLWVKKVEIRPGASSIAQRRAAAREQESQALSYVAEAQKQV